MTNTTCTIQPPNVSYKKIPYYYPKLKMPRICVMPVDGPVSALVHLWSKLPYAPGNLPTGAYGQYDDSTNSKKKYTPVFTEEYEWRGCPEAAIKTLGIFERREAFADSNSEFEFNFLNSKYLKFLRDNGAVYVEKDKSAPGNYVISAKRIQKLNTIYMPHVKNLKNTYKNFNPCSEKGFFFMPRNFTEKLVPGNIHNQKKSYDAHKIEFGFFDAYYDLYCNTCYNDNRILGSQFGAIVAVNGSPVTSYSSLGERWGWSKAKVCRFLKAFSKYLTVYSLGSNRGSVIYMNYFITEQFSSDLDNPRYTNILPTKEQVLLAFLELPKEIERTGADVREHGSPFTPKIKVTALIIKMLARFNIDRSTSELIAVGMATALLCFFPCFMCVSRKLTIIPSPHHELSAPPYLLA